jgi:hypothetical protein
VLQPDLVARVIGYSLVAEDGDVRESRFEDVGGEGHACRGNVA